MKSISSKTVSVILATHNGEKYISDQVRSIVEQTFAPSEIIVSDDASCDETLSIVHDLLANCSFSVTIHRNKTPLGFRDNFLRASLLAKGDFIAFCDQDDVWNPTKLEKCARFFDDQKISLIVHAARLIDAQSKVIGKFCQGIKETRIRQPLSYDPWSTFWGFSMVFRRELLELADINHRFSDYIVPGELIAHDRWIMLLAQMVGSTVEIKDMLVDYRQHSSNLFGAKKRARSPFGLGGRSANYIRATSQMIDVLSSISPTTKNNFPLFDRERCNRFLESALLQLNKRHGIYESSTCSEAIQRVWQCFHAEGYRSVHDGSIRWRSLLRDTQFAITGL